MNKSKKRKLPLQVRIDDPQLEVRLLEAAKKNFRSVTKEILLRLTQSFSTSP